MIEAGREVGAFQGPDAHHIVQDVGVDFGGIGLFAGMDRLERKRFEINLPWIEKIYGSEQLFKIL